MSLLTRTSLTKTHLLGSHLRNILMDSKRTSLSYFLNKPRALKYSEGTARASLGPPYIRASGQQVSVLRIKYCE